MLIAWLEQQAGGRSLGFSDPELGQLSRTDEDEHPDVGLLPASSLWAALGEAESHAGCGAAVQARARAERSGEPEPISILAGFLPDLTDLVHDAPPEFPLRLDTLVQRAHSHLNGVDDTVALVDMENGSQTLLFVQSLALTRAFADGTVAALPLADWRRHGESVGADAETLDQWFRTTTLAAAHILGDTHATPHLWNLLTSVATPALRWTAALAFVASPPDPVRHVETLAYLADTAAEPLFRPMLARAVADLAGAEVLAADRDGIQAIARLVLDQPYASRIPLALAVRARAVADGADRSPEPSVV